MNDSILLSTDAVVLCATDRLARDYRVRYNQRMREAGKGAWDTPNFQSVRAFAQQAWADTWPSQQILHASHELSLFMEVLGESSAEVMTPVSMARSARKAAVLALRYEIDTSGADDVLTAEQEAFHGWFNAAKRLLKDKGWLLQEQVYEALIEQIAADRYRPPESVVLAGFSHIAPNVQRLIDAMQNAGTKIEYAPEEAMSPAACDLARPQSIEDECRLVASSVRSLLSQAESPLNIGVVVPSADAYQDALDLGLTEYLAPDAGAGLGDDETRAWRWVRGRALARYPEIATAMAILWVDKTGNEFGALSRVLLSPDLWALSERGEAAATEFKLRRWGGLQYSLEDVCRAGVGDTATRFRALEDELASNAGTALPSTWASRFRKRLRLMGWLGGDDVGTIAYQAREVLDECLDTFSAMDTQVDTMGIAQARWWLREIVSTRSFEPKAAHVQPISIMEYADSEGAAFDAVFVLGASSAALPAQALPNPFLSGRKLDSAGYPLASPERALAWSVELIDGWGNRCGAVSVSCPAFGEKGTPLSPSPLFDGWGADGEACLDTHYGKLLASAPRQTMPTSDDVPALHAVGAERPVGGVKILRDFAEAPFFAFVRSRLAVGDMPDSKTGIDASTQGQLVHETLDLLWKGLVDRDGLRAALSAGIAKRVEEAVYEAAESKRVLPAVSFGKRLASLERRRCAALVTRWLEYEAARRDDFRVLHRELRAETRIDQLEMVLRIDRIDEIETAQGTKTLVMDYKTGSSVSDKGWATDTLSDPQLPIYTLSEALQDAGITRVDGIALAHAASTPRFVVTSNWCSALHDTKGADSAKDFSALQTQWKGLLEQRAAAFAAGEAGLIVDDIDRRSFNADLLRLVR